VLRALCLAASLVLPACADAAEPDPEERQRAMMVLEIENMAATAGLAEARRIDPRVLDAMRRVPRHRLVPDNIRAQAYRNSALPIGHEATISQPYIVALMTHLLQVKPEQRVLEVGTGSGYQAAVLAEMGAEVRTIEVVPQLAERAARDLASLGYLTVRVRAGDGYAGWPDEAPFDRIVVTAAATEIPNALVVQLKPGGRMVIPVGRPRSSDLTLVEKAPDGRVTSRAVMPVMFVPMVRGE
jgi:protein-L-isoaspartate(D-aspartate) O-methyltransferase